ncbi:MAG TPA: hypothetical protein VD836_13910 [Solirubrobacteraceae bacterium]|nr:hypothetical protein [Solirubrobacteraceae bacterium]
MARFLLEHRHVPGECASAFAAWLGFDSPLRHHAAASTCVAGGHVVWWHVDAADRHAALALFPDFVAERTDVRRVHDVLIP